MGHYLIRIVVESSGLPELLRALLTRMRDRLKAAYVGPETDGEREVHVEVECGEEEIGELLGTLKAQRGLSSVRAESVEARFLLNPYVHGARERS
ncbi:MAG: hypothetical protein QW410_05590 [Nitrososphaerota archaeon]